MKRSLIKNSKPIRCCGKKMKTFLTQRAGNNVIKQQQSQAGKGEAFPPLPHNIETKSDVVDQTNKEKLRRQKQKNLRCVSEKLKNIPTHQIKNKPKYACSKSEIHPLLWLKPQNPFAVVVQTINTICCCRSKRLCYFMQ